MFFTYAGDVSKATVKQRLLQSNHPMNQAYILTFENTADRDALVNHPDWQGATFIDVASLPYISAKKTSAYHSMVKSDAYRFVEGWTNKQSSWNEESLVLGNSSGVYVEMNRFIPRLRRPDMVETDSIERFNEILSAFHNVGIHVPVIYGIKTADIKKLGSGWVSLSSYVNGQIREMSQEKIEKINIIMISREINSLWFDYFKYGVETSNDNEQELKEIIMRCYDRTSMVHSRGGSLAFLKYMGYEFDLSLYQKTKSLIDEMLDAHPMLKLIMHKVCAVSERVQYYQIISDYVMDR